MYEYIDRKINRIKTENRKAFNNTRLTILAFDEINAPSVRKEVKKLYRKLRKRDRSFFLGLIDDLFVEYAISMIDAEEFLNRCLDSYNKTTLYVYKNEVERKESRYFETVMAISESAQGKKGRMANLNGPDMMDAQKRNIRYWNTQTEEIAVDIERDVFMEYAKEQGADEVQWITMADERVCPECGELHLKIFPVDKVPARPHIGCRCTLRLKRRDNK